MCTTCIPKRAAAIGTAGAWLAVYTARPEAQAYAMAQKSLQDHSVYA